MSLLHIWRTYRNILQLSCGSAYLNRPIDLSAGDLGGRHAEDCCACSAASEARQGDSGLCERSQHLRAVLLRKAPVREHAG
jgi:hypothetical protein